MHGTESLSSGGVAAEAPRVRRLKLADFRSYAALDLSVDAAMVALVGDNGAGKTNVLEALSLLAPGRGLRRAEFGQCARAEGRGGFAVSVEVETETGAVRLGTGIEPPEPDGAQARRCRIDRANVPSATAFAEHVRLVWLTPAMDTLFAGPAAERRRFLDRLVLTIDAEHGARTNALERALRARNRLLEERFPDSAWLDACEREAAELATAVAAARHECIVRLQALIEATRDDASPFPWAALRLDGEVEALVASAPALEAEEQYRAILHVNRTRDAAAGRTTVGPHVGDLLVRHGPKDIEAARASTGEQKALLTGLVLAHARLVRSMSGIAPLMLLDEIGAHFDPSRRAALFASLGGIGGQVWMTGADPALFQGMGQAIGTRADLLHVTPGRIVPLGRSC